MYVRTLIEGDSEQPVHRSGYAGTVSVTEPVVERVLGTETEFGITVLNEPDFNPVAAASALVNSYAGDRARIKWSFDEESPGRDARGLGYDLNASVRSPSRVS